MTGKATAAVSKATTLKPICTKATTLYASSRHHHAARVSSHAVGGWLIGGDSDLDGGFGFSNGLLLVEFRCCCPVRLVAEIGHIVTGPTMRQTIKDQFLGQILQAPVKTIKVLPIRSTTYAAISISFFGFTLVASRRTIQSRRYEILERARYRSASLVTTRRFLGGFRFGILVFVFSLNRRLFFQ